SRSAFSVPDHAVARTAACPQAAASENVPPDARGPACAAHARGLSLSREPIMTSSPRSRNPAASALPTSPVPSIAIFMRPVYPRESDRERSRAVALPDGPAASRPARERIFLREELLDLGGRVPGRGLPDVATLVPRDLGEDPLRNDGPGLRLGDVLVGSVRVAMLDEEPGR